MGACNVQSPLRPSMSVLFRWYGYVARATVARHIRPCHARARVCAWWWTVCSAAFGCSGLCSFCSEGRNAIGTARRSYFRAVAIITGVIGLVERAQERYTLEGPGGMFPQENFEIQELWNWFWDQFWANTMLLGGQATEFHMNAILPIASYTNGVGFPIQFVYRPKATPFAGEARL